MKRMGRPPTGQPRKVQISAFLVPEDAAWLMALPPKQRSLWLAQMIESERKFDHLSADNSAPPEDEALGSHEALYPP